MRAYVRGHLIKRVVLESENRVEENLIKSYSKKKPRISGFSTETRAGKSTHRATLTLVFE